MRDYVEKKKRKKGDGSHIGPSVVLQTKSSGDFPVHTTQQHINAADERLHLGGWITQRSHRWGARPATRRVSPWRVYYSVDR